MSSEEYKDLVAKANEFRRLAYTTKILADTGRPPRTRADLTSWTDEQKLDRQLSGLPDDRRSCENLIRVKEFLTLGREADVRGAWRERLARVDLGRVRIFTRS